MAPWQPQRAVPDPGETRLHRFLAVLLTAAALAGLAAASSCGSDATEPPVEAVRLSFSTAELELGESRTGLVVLRNDGRRAGGPVQLAVGPVTDSAGQAVSGAQVQVTPSALETLVPGQMAVLEVRVETATTLGPGPYRATLQARVSAAAADSLAIRFRVPRPPDQTLRASVRITAGPASVRQGDVVGYAAEARDSAGSLQPDGAVRWAVLPASGGIIEGDGRFVGYTPGTVQVVAGFQAAADTVAVEVSPRGLSGSFQVVANAQHGLRFTSDLWLHGNHAYTGTWGVRTVDSVTYAGDRLFVWDISNPASPALTDSVALDARTVNDVKVRTDGALAVATHEGSSDGRNGITLLDLADPAHPRVLARFTDGLESGVHNTWIEGNYVYAVTDGSGGLRIIDVSNPASPQAAAGFHGGSSFVHDVYVRDGLAFLSHWDAGLIILDVGNGIAGGSPTSPREVGRVITDGGNVHNAWFWPGGGYVFIGEEDFRRPGFMHVVDGRDLRRPREVASFRVPGSTPHNFWMDEERRILYLAWYENGVRALDVSGELLGELDRQGREIAFTRYAGGGACFSGAGTCTWAPQLHRGLVFASDANSGLWVLRPTF